MFNWWMGLSDLVLIGLNQKMFEISKVLRMGLPIVENLSGPCAIVFSLFKVPQFHFNEKSKTLVELY